MKDTPTAIRSREYRARKKAGAVLPRTPREPVDKPGASLTVTQNTAEAVWVGRVLSLGDLLEVCAVNTDVWKVVEFSVNKWEVGAYSRQTDKFNVEPLFQVKARLIRKDPEPVKPFVRPLEIKVSIPKAVKRPSAKPLRYVVIPDVQIGFRKSLRTGRLTPHHDRLAMDVVHQIVQVVMPDGIVIGGDLLDLADWSDKYLRTPNLQYTTQPSLIEAAWWMGRMRKYAEHAWLIEGNHEERLVDAIVKDMPEAYGLRPVDMMDRPPALSIPNLLGLKSLDIEWVGDYPNGRVDLGNLVSVVHGDVARGKSGATSAALLPDALGHLIVNHIHRIECAYNTMWAGDAPIVRSVWSFGCLCRLDSQVPGIRGHMNWQQGIGIVDIDEGSDGTVSAVDIHPVLIENGIALFEDTVYRGEDYVDKLEEDTGWPFAREA
jgi:hypothetical protein